MSTRRINACIILPSSGKCFLSFSHYFYNLTGKQQCGVVNVLQTKKDGGQDIGKKKGRKQKPYILPPPIIRRKKKNAIRLCYRLLAPV